jgi:hypothetical protein
MIVRINVAASNAILAEGLDHFDGASITWYTEGDGLPAQGGGDIGTSVAVATGTLPTPAFASPLDRGRAPLEPWTAFVSGGVDEETLHWARVESAAGAVIDMDAGVIASPAEFALNLPTLVVSTGDVIRAATGTGIILPMACEPES